VPLGEGLVSDVWALECCSTSHCGSTVSLFQFISRTNYVKKERENIFRTCWGGGGTRREAVKTGRAQREGRSPQVCF